MTFDFAAAAFAADPSPAAYARVQATWAAERAQHDRLDAARALRAGRRLDRPAARRNYVTARQVRRVLLAA